MANMPFVSGKVAQTALQAGLADDSFGMGYKGENERQLQKAAADAKLRDLIKGKELDAQLAIDADLRKSQEEEAQYQRDLTTAEELRSKHGPYANVNAGGVSIGGISRPLQGNGLQDKLDDNYRLETAAVQNRYESYVKGAQAQLAALDDALRNIQNPSTITKRGLQGNLAKVYDSGALTNRDIEDSIGGTTAKGLGAGLAGFFGVDTNPYTKVQQEQVFQLLKDRRAAIANRIAQAGKEISASAPTLAPTLARSGRLQPLLDSLGSRLDKENPAVGGLDPEREELNRRRAAAKGQK